MPPSPQELLSVALELPPVERGKLAALLIDSLDKSADPDHDEAWTNEIAHRLAELDSGRVPVIPWAEVQRRMRASDNVHD